MHALPSKCERINSPYINVSRETLQVCYSRAKALPRRALAPQRWLYPDYILWQIGDWKTTRPLRETLLDVLIDHLKYTFGKEWADAQYALSTEQRHVVMRWWFSWCESSKSMAPPHHRPGQFFGFRPTGDMMELGTLAYDLYHLRLAAAMDPALLKRLRSYDQFQGARYELAIAASMARSGFDIRWMHGVSAHCEFEAKSKSTGETIAVEVKSRHVPGTLNNPGIQPVAERMRFVAHRYYNEAIRQCPTDEPCAVFINLNLTPWVKPGDHHIPWWPEMQKLIDALPRCSPIKPTAETCLVLTNFAGHFAGSNEAPENQFVFTFPKYVRHPLKHEATLIGLLQAVESFGQIPIIE